MPTITAKKIIFDRKDWLAGLHPQYTATGQYAQTGGNFASTQSCFNPFRFLGYAGPGFNTLATTNASTVLSSYIRNGFNSGANAYLIENGAKIHRFAIASNTFLNDAGGVGFPHTVSAHAGHNTPVLNDCVLYNHKVGGTSALRFLYSWSDDTDWDIGTQNMHLTTPAFDDDFMSTAPATPLDLSSGYEGGKGYPHPLIVGADDILYIGDRNFVHAYDGQNSADDDGKFYPEALTLPEGWVITSFAKIAPKTLCVFAYYSNTSSGDTYYNGSAKCFFWNYIDLDPFDIEDLDDNFVSEAFEYQGTVGCFTSGRPTDLANGTKNSKLRLYDGNKFVITAPFIGNLPIRGGVEVLGKEIRWLTSNGSNIFSWNNNFGLDPTLNIVGTSQNAATASGMLRTFALASSIASSQADTSYYFNTVISNYYSSASYVSSLVELDENIDITEIRVKFLYTASGGRDFTLTIQDEFGTTTSTIISGLSTITALNKTLTIPALKTDGGRIPSLRRFKIALSWSVGSGASDCPIVSQIELSYQPSKY